MEVIITWLISVSFIAALVYLSIVSRRNKKARYEERKKKFVDEYVARYVAEETPKCHDYPKTFVAIDTETADSSTGYICQIAAVLVVDSEIKGEYCSLVKPPFNEYNPYNVRIHNISSHMTEQSPEFPEVWSKISAWIFETGAVAAHNASADISNIQKSLRFYQSHAYELDACTIIDTCIELGKANLYSCCQYYGIPLESHHDALCDARACALLAMRINGHDCPEIPHLKEPAPRKCRNDLPVLYNDTPFSGKTIVVSGIFREWPDRERLKDFLCQCGARVTSSLSSRTDIFITGYDPGPSKVEKFNEMIEAGGKLRRMEQDEMDAIIRRIKVSSAD